jgi:hypothetical protein
MEKSEAKVREIPAFILTDTIINCEKIRVEFLFTLALQVVSLPKVEIFKK